MTAILLSFVLFAPACGGGKDTGDTQGDDDTAECVGELEDTPCADEDRGPYVCDSCGTAVGCGLRSGELVWLRTAIPCECLTEDGEIDEELCPEVY